MKMLAMIKRIFLVLFLVCLVGFFSTKKANAAELKMRQAILPVYFVYLDEKGEIEKIWNNVRQTDDFYVLKFINSKNAKISPSRALFEKYANLKKDKKELSNKLERRISFVRTEKGMEEIETVV